MQYRIASTLAIAAIAATTTPSFAGDYFEGAARAQAFERLGQLRAVQARYEGEILRRKGIISMGVALDRASGQLIFEIVAEEDGPRPRVPARLDGVPVRLSFDTHQAPVNGGNACVPCHANQLSLPVQMGNSGRTIAAGSNCGACTMGFKACEEQTGDAVWVTSAHCATDGSTCPGSAPIGANAAHVSPLDAPTCNTATSNVGTLSAQAPPVAGGTVDAAAIDSDAGLTQTSIRDIGAPSATPGNALPGDEVQKSGRTTGYTTGEVTAVGVSVNVAYNCGTRTMNDQIRIESDTVFCLGGDSGSGVLDFESPPRVVGLIMSGNAAGTRCHANDIANVLAALGLSMNHSACVEDSCPALVAADETPNRELIVGDLYRLRDDVLGGSEQGKAWIRRFYDVAPAWFDLYREDRELLQSTANALAANADVLSSIVRSRTITVPRARLRGVRRLLARHRDAAGNPALRNAFEAWRVELGRIAVQQAFKVKVQ